MDIGYNAVSVTPSYIVDRPRKDFQTSFAVDISGTINYTVQSTLQDVFANKESDIYWVDHATVAAATGDAASNYIVPVVAVRVKVNSLTDGATLKFMVIGG
jgi:hypothetical protein